ncbi:MAG TPA: L-2-hydroxyglutarate oxidase [Longimicrobium sp.]
MPGHSAVPAVGGGVAVVGGGLVGLGTAYALLRRAPGSRVVLFEKEARPGMHQSTHNSGVLHAGLYYKPGSSKARLAVAGIRRMTEFCREHGVAHEICGKLVVATDETEVPRLRTLLERGTQNGLRGLRWLGAEAAHEIEPHVRCVAAVHVPEEGIADYAGVVRALAAEVERLGGTIVTGAAVTSLRSEGGGWRIFTTAGEHQAGFLVNCAGLHSDRVAAMAGESPPCRIVPFRGEYFTLRPERAHLVRNLVYPVPDPSFPFLGVHFTRMVGGGIEAGPNAVLALAREGYTKGRIDARDVGSALAFPGLWRFVGRHWRTTASELRRSFSRSLFTRALQRLVPEVGEADLLAGGAGVRAQAMLPNGQLVDDFLFVEGARALHVLNAPSPAATASLTIGEEIASRVASHAAGTARPAGAAGPAASYVPGTEITPSA